ncbi:MAG: hypothetical protein RLO01_13470 [Thalassobaculaceae bacterium]
MKSNDTTLVISRNDLEAAEIIEIGRKSGCRIIELNEPWGWVLDGSSEALSPDKILTERVILIEAPSLAYEERLRESGKFVQIVDHHLSVLPDGTLLDRRNSRSSLEQVCSLLGIRELSDRQRLVAANDREFWPGLIDVGALKLDKDQGVPEDRLSELTAIRLDDLANRFMTIKDGHGHLPADLPAARRAAKSALGTAVDWFEAVRKKASVDASGCAVCLDTGREAKGHPKLWVLRAPENLAPVLMDAVYLGLMENVLRRGEVLDILVVYGVAGPDGNFDPMGEITRLEFSGSERHVALIEQIAAGLTVGRSRLAHWAGASATTCFFGAAGKGEPEPVALSQLGDRFLNNLLQGNRPLWRWCTQFLQVLDIREAGEAGANGCFVPHITEAGLREFLPVSAGPEERNYFLPNLRSYLVPSSAEVPQSAGLVGMDIDPDDLSIRSYSYLGRGAADELAEVAASGETKQKSLRDRMIFRIRLPETDDEQAKVIYEETVKTLTVHFCFDGLVFLEWSFSGGLGKSFSDDDGNMPLWKAILASALPGPGLRSGVTTVAQALDFNAFACRCFSAFENGSERRDLCLKIDDGAEVVLPFAAMIQEESEVPKLWFRALAEFALKPFGIDVDRTRMLFDDRARIVSSIVGVGAQPSDPAGKSREDVLLARSATVDGFATFHAYDSGFAVEEWRSGYYPRFRSWGSHYSITDHSLVLFAYGGFAATHGVRHVATMYRRMFLIGQFYSATFASFYGQLAAHSRARLRLDQKRQDPETCVYSKSSLDCRERRCSCVVNSRLDGMIRRMDEHAERQAIADKVDRLRGRFTGFANGLWFDQVSSEVQARELFEIITRQLRVAQSYQELLNELERTNELEHADGEERRERIATEITVLSSGLAGMIVAGEIWDKLVGFDNLVSKAGSVPVALAVGAFSAVIVVSLLKRRSIGQAARDVCDILKTISFLLTNAVFGWWKPAGRRR